MEPLRARASRRASRTHPRAAPAARPRRARTRAPRGRRRRTTPLRAPRARGAPASADGRVHAVPDRRARGAAGLARATTSPSSSPRAGARLETAEHEPSPSRVVEPRPLRPAPAKPAAEAPRKRPAPNAPRQRARRRTPAKPPRVSSNSTPLGPPVLRADRAGRDPRRCSTSPTPRSSRSTATGEGNVAVTIPEGADAGEVGKLLAAKQVIDSARYFELNATISGDRGNLRPGKYTLKKGMKNGDVIAALTKAPAAATPAPTVKLTIVEGPVAQGERAGRRQVQEGQGRATRRRRRRRTRSRASASSARRRAPRPPRASCSRRPTTLPEGSQRERSGQQAARRVRGELQADRHEVREAQEPLALRRADHRVDDRTRGAAGEGAPARLSRHLQPAEGGYAIADRRDDPLLHEQLDPPDQAVRARRPAALQPAASTAGCRRRRSATPGSRR